MGQDFALQAPGELIASYRSDQRRHCLQNLILIDGSKDKFSWNVYMTIRNTNVAYVIENSAILLRLVLNAVDAHLLDASNAKVRRKRRRKHRRNQK